MSKSSKKIFKKAYRIATAKDRPTGPYQLAREILHEIDRFTSACEKHEILILFQELFDGINGRTQMFLRYVRDTAQELLKDDGTQTKPAPRQGKRRPCKTDGTRTPSAGFDLND